MIVPWRLGGSVHRVQPAARARVDAIDDGPGGIAVASCASAIFLPPARAFCPDAGHFLHPVCASSKRSEFVLQAWKTQPIAGGKTNPLPALSCQSSQADDHLFPPRRAPDGAPQHQPEADPDRSAVPRAAVRRDVRRAAWLGAVDPHHRQRAARPGHRRSCARLHARDAGPARCREYRAGRQRRLPADLRRGRRQGRGQPRRAAARHHRQSRLCARAGGAQAGAGLAAPARPRPEHRARAAVRAP
ncbi:hypothetical protein D9M68_574580 [compost metagenome]